MQKVTQVFEETIVGDPLTFWDTFKERMEVAVRKYCDQSQPDGDPQFHKDCFLGSYRAGMRTFKYIAVEDGIFGLGMGATPLEHWFFIGSLFNCATELPCSPEQFASVIHLLPCSQGSMISKKVQSLCTLNTFKDGGDFLLPESLETYISNAPYKQRSDWGRLIRKANASGLSVHSRIDWKAVADLTPGYLEYWKGNHDSYVDEAAMVENYIDLFKCYEENALGITLYLNGVPVAVNMGWVKGDTFHDMLCIRNMAPELKSFNMGIVSVLLSVESCIKKGLKTYSLSSGDQGYKKQFMYGTNSEYQAINVISDLDVALRNGQQGYLQGHKDFLSVTSVRKLAASMPEDVLASIVAAHPFVTDVAARRKPNPLTRSKFHNVINNWPESDNYSLNKKAWLEVADYTVSNRMEVFGFEGNLFSLAEEGTECEQFQDLHTLTIVHPEFPYGSEEMCKVLLDMSGRFSQTMVQGTKVYNSLACSVESKIAVGLKGNNLTDYLASLSSSNRSTITRALKLPFASCWDTSVSDWAWLNYVNKWSDPWLNLQMIYARSLVSQGLAQTLRITLEGHQVGECYFVVTEGTFKFIAASFAPVNGIGVVSQAMAIERCISLGLDVYDPSERSNYEDGDYAGYKKFLTNSKKDIYCYAAVKDGTLTPPYALDGTWVLEENNEKL